MTQNDMIALLPLIITASAMVVVLLAIAIRRSHRAAFLLTLAGLAAALGSIAFALPAVPRQVTALLIVDSYALLFTGIILGAAFIITMLSYHYWKNRDGIHEEYYILLLAGVAGAIALTASRHFAALFLGLEIMSVAIFALAAYQRSSLRGLEAGIKYLILSGVSSPFLLFGMALLYATTGSMQLAEVIAFGTTAGMGVVYLTGLALVLAGIAFKLALFPFHLWVPDVYEGAPAIVTAFVATISKGAMVALLIRFFRPMQMQAGEAFTLVFSVLAIASMFTGNFLALRQANLKRLLAYSSITNMGYLLVAFVAGGGQAVAAMTFFLLGYIVTTLGAFGVIASVSGHERDVDITTDYREMAWRHPWMAAVLTACLLSLAGLPLTVGFVGKFFLVMAGVRDGLWLLVIMLAINSGISLYYYLRVVRELYRHPQTGVDGPLVTVRASWLGGIALAAIMLTVIWLGVYPAPVLRVIEMMVSP